MFAMLRSWIGIAALLLAFTLMQSAAGQPPPVPTAPPSTAPVPPPTPPKSAPTEKVEYPPPPPATAVAASVNGQPIPEISVYRALLQQHPKNWPNVRKEVLNYLVDNVLVDQYLTQLNVVVEAKEIDDRVTQIKAEAKKEGMEFPKLLERLHLTEDVLRRELASALRWDKFVLQQGTDKVLQEMFDKNKNMFDGSQMQARHILLATSVEVTPQAAQIKLAGLRKQIDDEVAVELAKLPATTGELAREQERMKLLDKAFAAAAAKESTCPSKEEGGSLGWFPRAGAMVEPFARAAFALKPYQMSEPVATEFGVHLIMAVDSKAGRDVKFEDVRPFVQEIYGERLREAIIANYKPRSKIEVAAVK